MFAFANTLKAQWPTTASSFVPPHHWSYEVLRRLDAAGKLPPGVDIARRAMPQEEIAALLEYAQTHVDAFRKEFPQRRTLSESTSYTFKTGTLLVGHGYDQSYEGPVEQDDVRKFGVQIRGATQHGAFAGAIALNEDGLSELQAVAAGSRVGIWLGRREFGAAVGNSAGITVDNHSFDGVGFYLTRPLNISILGPVRFETHLSKIENVLNREFTETESHPFFWFMRGSFEPIHNFRIGVNRGMMFGGEGNYPVTFTRLFNNVIGLRYTANGENSFANQLVSVDARLHPVPDWPLSLYLEWGAEDAAGGWWHQPGILGGFEVGVSPDVLVGLERTEFGRNRVSNGLWYQNAWFQKGWSDDGELLGHPLGGDGMEWRVFGNGDISGVHFNATSYLRRRGPQNVFAPLREGRSAGIALRLDVPLNDRVRIKFDGEREWSRESAAWAMTTLHVAGKINF